MEFCTAKVSTTEEPDAGKPHVRICMGGSLKEEFLPLLTFREVPIVSLEPRKLFHKNRLISDLKMFGYDQPWVLTNLVGIASEDLDDINSVVNGDGSKDIGKYEDDMYVLLSDGHHYKVSSWHIDGDCFQFNLGEKVSDLPES